MSCLEEVERKTFGISENFHIVFAKIIQLISQDIS